MTRLFEKFAILFVSALTASLIVFMLRQMVVSTLPLPVAAQAQVEPSIVAYPEGKYGHVCYINSLTPLAAPVCLPIVGTAVDVPGEATYVPPSATPGATLEPRPTNTPVGIIITKPPLTETPPTPKPTITKTQTPEPPPPTPSPTPLSPALGLVNGGFEQGAQGWTRFALYESAEWNEERLSLGASPSAVLVPDASLRFYNQWRCWDAGAYQRVAVPAGTHVQFSVSGITWANTSDNFSLPHDVNVYSKLWAGIDAQGFTDAANSGVRWAVVDGGRTWHTATTEAISQNAVITVFIRASLGVNQVGECRWPLFSMMAFFDKASLAVVP